MTPLTTATDSKPKLYKNPWAIAFAIGVVALTVQPMLASLSYKAPPPIAALGNYSLVSETGAPFVPETLHGKVWIASFFFSRCPSVCPQQQADMKSMLSHFDDMADRVQFVSFSVDPEFDTPAVLQAYQRKLGADASRWRFVTGEKAMLKTLLVDRMHVDMGERQALAGSPDLFDISHAARFALIDQNGDVRGFWPTDAEGRGNIINAARLLAKRGPKP